MIDIVGQWLLPPRYNGIGDARQITCGSAVRQWVAIALDENHRWGRCAVQ